MSPLLDRSNPLWVRITFGAMLVAMIAALGWALTLLAKATDHPYRVLLVAGGISVFNLIGLTRRWTRASQEP